ncbi:MAG: DnaJ domain-containing protein [Elusimicrobiales bacterium]|nr:DnaJ domain-containing protein [Elusimicrobiales bacterium]
MENKNFYEILGIKKNASSEEIKQAYYREIKKYHPDTYSGMSEEKIKELNARAALINEAYSTLSDPEKRRQYDYFLKTSAAGEMPENDFFRNMYGSINPENFKQKMEEVKAKMAEMKKGPILKVWNEVLAMWQYLNDDKVPLLKKLLPLAALLYLVLPVDLIPDFIPLAGLGDDVAIIMWVFYQYYDQLKEYMGKK